MRQGYRPRLSSTDRSSSLLCTNRQLRPIARGQAQLLSPHDRSHRQHHQHRKPDRQARDRKRRKAHHLPCDRAWRAASTRRHTREIECAPRACGAAAHRVLRRIPACIRVTACVCWDAVSEIRVAANGTIALGRVPLIWCTGRRVRPSWREPRGRSCGCCQPHPADRRMPSHSFIDGPCNRVHTWRRRPNQTVAAAARGRHPRGVTSS